MRIPRVYCEVELAIGEIISLPPDTSHHLRNVLKRAMQDKIIVFNGKGGNYHGKIVDDSKKGVSIVINEFDQENIESTLNLNLGQALIKPDHMDLIIQKSVEIGASAVTPLITKRSVIKLSTERMANKLRHWRQIAVSASEQSGRTNIMRVNEPTKFSSWIESKEQGLNIYLHPTNAQRIEDLPLKAKSVNLLIGPEGGFDTAEIHFLQSTNWYSISLGRRILRAETASITMLSILQHRFGDMH